MDYFLKASIVITLFYLCYTLFLQRETFFQYNRWFLLIGLFIAVVLPFVVIPIYIEYTPTPINSVETAQFLAQPIVQQPKSITFLEVLPYVYLLGLLFFIARLFTQFLSLISLFRKHKKTKNAQFYFIETENNSPPFSFFNRIVFNPNHFSTKELELIIAHEKVHARQLHSIDVIIVQLAIIFFWFNPLVWFYKKALQQNLEFIADREAQGELECLKSYQKVLLKASINKNQLTLSNNFYQSLIKKRIIMLQKTKSKKSNKLKLIIVLPLLAFFLMSFSVEEIYVSKVQIEIDSAKTETFVIKAVTNDKELEYIKKQLEAQTELIKIRFSEVKRDRNNKIINLTIETKYEGETNYKKHITYKHKDNKPIGNIAIKVENDVLIFGYEAFDMNMKVNKDGLSTFFPKTATKKVEVKTKDPYFVIDKTLDTLQLDIQTFSLDENGVKSDNTEYDYSKPPLVIIDGKERAYSDVKLALLNQNTIGALNVITGKDATKKYGAKGINGVIEITSLAENDLISKTNTNKKTTPDDSKASLGINFNSDNIFILSNTLNDSLEIMTLTKQGNLIKNGRILTSSDSLQPFLNNKKNKSFTMVTTQTTKGEKLLNENVKFILDTKANDPIYVKRNIDIKNEKQIIIINGKRASLQEFSKLTPNEIKSITHLQNDIATNVYGDIGKNGAILVTTVKFYEEDTKLYLLDGVEISKANLYKIYSNETMSHLKVLDKEEAKERYGAKGDHGVVEVTSKKDKKSSSNKNNKTFNFTSDKNDNKKESPWKVEVSKVSYTDDDDSSKDGTVFYISKITPKSILEQHKTELKALDIDMKYSKLRRNKSGEITSVKIELSDNNGRKSSATFKDNKGIPKIMFGKKENKLIVTSSDLN